MAEKTRLEEIEKRLSEATPGPYEATEHRDAPDEFWCIHQVGGGALDWGEADCQFLAHSWADLRGLLAVAKAAHELDERIQDKGILNMSGTELSIVVHRFLRSLDALEKPADG